MSPRMRKGLLVAALHVAIVTSVGAKLLVDRATRPRVWARAAPVDPDLPIRGRYVSLRVEADLDEGAATGLQLSFFTPVSLAVRDQRLFAVPSTSDTGVLAQKSQRDGRTIAVLQNPLAYFIPEHVTDPSRRAAGEELWVEVTVPGHGPPRPIRVGIKKDGVLTPLNLR
jgi:uncharacterized membrane-anchored protein